MPELITQQQVDEALDNLYFILTNFVRPNKEYNHYKLKKIEKLALTVKDKKYRTLTQGAKTMRQQWQILSPAGITWGHFAGLTPKSALEYIAKNEGFKSWGDYALSLGVSEQFNVKENKILLQLITIDI